MKKKKRFEVSIKDSQTRRGQIDRSTHLPTSYRIILFKDWIKTLRGIFKEYVPSIENAFESFYDYSPIDLSKSPERYVIRDALFALDHLPPYQLINSIVTQTAGGKGRTQ